MRVSAGARMEELAMSDLRNLGRCPTGGGGHPWVIRGSPGDHSGLIRWRGPRPAPAGPARFTGWRHPGTLNGMSPRYRFGPFEADAAGSLRRNAEVVRLQAQPFQLLMLLLECGGRVASREKIRERLWPDTVVDFDHSLNAAMNKLRRALADGSGAEVLETAGRSGYRLLLPVEVLEEAAPRTLLTAPADVPAANRTLVRMLFVAAQLMYLAFYLAALGHLNGVETALAWWRGDDSMLFWVVLATACAGIPVRLF